MFNFPVDVAAILTAVPAVKSADGFEWRSLIPVFALILGFVLKWVQDAWSETRRERRSEERRAYERKALKMAKRDEAELLNLVAVQPLVSEYGRGMLLSIAAAAAREDEGLGWYIADDCPGYEQSRLARMSMWPITCRLHNRQISDHLLRLAQVAGDLKKSADKNAGKVVYANVVTLGGEAHELIGAEIRRLQDPDAC